MSDHAGVGRARTRRRFGLLVRVTRQADRSLLVLILGTLVLSAVAGAMLSLGLKIVVNRVLDHDLSAALAASLVAAFGAGLLGSAGRAMSDAEHVVTNQVGLLIDHNSLALASGMPGIEHLENPEYLDQLALVRGGGPSLMRAVFTLSRTASLAISMASSLVLLGAVHPVLLLLPVFAVPAAVLLPRSEHFVDAARARSAERQRAATQLHRLFVTPGPAMELRVFGACDRIDRRSDELWREVSNVQLRGALQAALMQTIGWVTLAGGYVGALWFTAHLAVRGDATVGDVVMVSQLALLLRGNVAETADAVRQAAAALRTADRFLWLEDLAAAETETRGTGEAPVTLVDGIRFERVSFAYQPGAEPVLHDVDLHLPAGSTVAIVGGNGAGKTTLVKLLTGMYQPTAGLVVVDGVDLASIAPESWRAVATGAFQDYLRLEATARVSIGVGAVGALHDDGQLDRAIELGGARSVVDALPHGVDSHLGKVYADGAQLSGGQWQRLAIARSMMPDAPLCLILDEPASALDPEAEQRLFEAFRARTRELRDRGAITVLVSHRFSTVRMADSIAVLSGGRIREHGTHAELMAIDGTYAAMYRQQAEAYS